MHISAGDFLRALGWGVDDMGTGWRICAPNWKSPSAVTPAGLLRVATCEGWATPNSSEGRL